MKKFFAAVVLMMFGSPLLAMGFQLAPNKWESLVIPGNPEGYTLGQLLGDDLAGLTYGEDWAVFVFDAPTQAYIAPESLSSEIETAQAFWIIQLSDQTVELDLPEGLPEAEPSLASHCADNWYSLTLPARSTDVAPSSMFHLVGSPFSSGSDVADFRLVTEPSGASCVNGCDLDEAGLAEYSKNFFYVYNSGSNQYEQFDVSTTISPWQGFWLEALPALQPHAPRLNIPYTES